MSEEAVVDIVVQYGDKYDKTRWGFLTRHGVVTLNEYLSKTKKLEESSGNEILKAEVDNLSKTIVNIYLPDGTTGDADLRSLSFVEPFAKYRIREELPK